MSSLFDPWRPAYGSSLPTVPQLIGSLPSAPISTEPIRRTVFVSHSHLHELETKQFLREFGGVFIQRHLGVSDRDDFIDSTNTDYVMSQVRQRYIGGATVTILLVGTCTHSRRYVDWEIKASLQQGRDRLPSGLLAIQLPSSPNGAILPDRFRLNLRRNDGEGYARYYQYPRNSAELRRWIEEAFQARRTIADRIVNPNEMMRNNGKCQVCGVWH